VDDHLNGCSLAEVEKGVEMGVAEDAATVVVLEGGARRI